MRLIEFKRRKSKMKLNSVFNAIKELGNPKPHDIKKYLDEMARKEVQDMYHNGEISSEQIQTTIMEKTMDIRTIQRKLKELTYENLVEHTHDRYSLAEKVKSDIRYQAELFGIGLYRLIFEYVPPGSIKNEIEELVKYFGAQVLYTFLEAACPVNDDTMSNTEKDEFVLTWVKNAIPIEGMYYTFIDIGRSGKNMETNEPRFTLDLETVRDLTKTFGKLYPKLHSTLLRERYRFMFGSKSRHILDKTKGISSNPWFIDYKEGDD